MPTLLDVLGIEPPSTVDGVPQRPLEGVSFASTLADADAPDRHDTQYYEMFGCRALYHRGWKAVTYHEMYAASREPGFDGDTWELYDVEADPSECHDLAAARPELLRELVDRWWIEAEKYQVLPLDDRPLSELVLERPTGLPERSRYVYHPAGMVPEAVAARLYNRSHRIVAEVEVGDEPVDGVLVSQGNVLGGWVLFVRGGALTYVHNYVGLEEHRVSGPLSLSSGRHALGFTFTRSADNAGTGSLTVDGTVIATGEIAPFTPMRFSLTGAGVSFGYSPEAPVCDDIAAPYRFAGRIRQVVIEVDGEVAVDADGEAAIAIATQ
jgi:arylsulfatase